MNTEKVVEIAKYSMISLFILIVLGRAIYNYIRHTTITLGHYNSQDKIMTLHYKDGHTERFTGSSTVWYTYPLCKRCSTDMEIVLSEIYTYHCKHGSPYPKAHLRTDNKR